MTNPGPVGTATDLRRASLADALTVTTQDDLKRLAGIEAARDVADGMIVGLGTGSTVEWTIREIARRVHDEELNIQGIPTSERSARLADTLKIPLTSLDEHPVIDVTIDGADEVDPDFDLVKGGGGALTREKICAFVTKREVIVVDPTKLVRFLGDAFPLPVEVLPMAQRVASEAITRMGAEVRLRHQADGPPYRTDNHMAILDCRFPGGIRDKKTLEAEIDLLPGVLENGLFLGLCHEVVVGTAQGPVRMKPGEWIGP